MPRSPCWGDPGVPPAAEAFRRSSGADSTTASTAASSRRGSLQEQRAGPARGSSSSSVTVAVRVRPMAHGGGGAAPPVLKATGTSISVLHAAAAARPEKQVSNRFTFDHVYWSVPSHASSVEYATQKMVYKDLGGKVLDDALQGYHSSLLAYGQTGSGKTYSLFGGERERGKKTDYTQQGIVPRLVHALYERVADDELSTEFSVELSFYQIYMERVTCLLSGTGEVLKVREHPSTGPYVEDLTTVHCPTKKAMTRHLSAGNRFRKVSHTKQNSRSSRSHAIISIRLTQRAPGEGGQAGRRSAPGTELHTTSSSKISLVDLAGSERISKSGAAGAGVAETSSINQSLSVLGHVIANLASRIPPTHPSRAAGPAQRRGLGGHVPYRDSMLTWLLKESLGGNSKTVMLATVSAAPQDREETLSTLRYADQAKKIENHAVVNDATSMKTVIDELTLEVQSLQAQLAAGADHALRQKLDQTRKLMAQTTQRWDARIVGTRQKLEETEEEARNLKRENRAMEGTIQSLSARLSAAQRQRDEAAATAARLLETHLQLSSQAPAPPPPHPRPSADRPQHRSHGYAAVGTTDPGRSAHKTAGPPLRHPPVPAYPLDSSSEDDDEDSESSESSSAMSSSAGSTEENGRNARPQHGRHRRGSHRQQAADAHPRRRFDGGAPDSVRAWLSRDRTETSSQGKPPPQGQNNRGGGGSEQPSPASTWRGRGHGMPDEGAAGSRRELASSSSGVDGKKHGAAAARSDCRRPRVSEGQHLHRLSTSSRRRCQHEAALGRRSAASAAGNGEQPARRARGEWSRSSTPSDSELETAASGSSSVESELPGAAGKRWPAPSAEAVAATLGARRAPRADEPAADADRPTSSVESELLDAADEYPRAAGVRQAAPSAEAVAATRRWHQAPEADKSAADADRPTASLESELDAAGEYPRAAGKRRAAPSAESSQFHRGNRASNPEECGLLENQTTTLSARRRRRAPEADEPAAEADEPTSSAESDSEAASRSSYRGPTSRQFPGREAPAPRCAAASVPVTSSGGEQPRPWLAKKETGSHRQQADQTGTADSRFDGGAPDSEGPSAPPRAWLSPRDCTATSQRQPSPQEQKHSRSLRAGKSGHRGGSPIDACVAVDLRGSPPPASAGDDHSHRRHEGTVAGLRHRRQHDGAPLPNARARVRKGRRGGSLGAADAASDESPCSSFSDTPTTNSCSSSPSSHSMGPERNVNRRNPGRSHGDGRVAGDDCPVVVAPSAFKANAAACSGSPPVAGAHGALLADPLRGLPSRHSSANGACGAPHRNNSAAIPSPNPRHGVAAPPDRSPKPALKPRGGQPPPADDSASKHHPRRSSPGGLLAAGVLDGESQWSADPGEVPPVGSPTADSSNRTHRASRDSLHTVREPHRGTDSSEIPVSLPAQNHEHQASGGCLRARDSLGDELQWAADASELPVVSLTTEYHERRMSRGSLRTTDSLGDELQWVADASELPVVSLTTEYHERRMSRGSLRTTDSLENESQWAADARDLPEVSLTTENHERRMSRGSMRTTDSLENESQWAADARELPEVSSTTENHERRMSRGSLRTTDSLDSESQRADLGSIDLEFDALVESAHETLRPRRGVAASEKGSRAGQSSTAARRRPPTPSLSRPALRNTYMPPACPPHGDEAPPLCASRSSSVSSLKRHPKGSPAPEAAEDARSARASSGRLPHADEAALPLCASRSSSVSSLKRQARGTENCGSILSSSGCEAGLPARATHHSASQDSIRPRHMRGSSAQATENSGSTLVPSACAPHAEAALQPRASRNASVSSLDSIRKRYARGSPAPVTENSGSTPVPSPCPPHADAAMPLRANRSSSVSSLDSIRLRHARGSAELATEKSALTPHADVLLSRANPSSVSSLDTAIAPRYATRAAKHNGSAFATCLPHANEVSLTSRASRSPSASPPESIGERQSTTNDGSGGPPPAEKVLRSSRSSSASSLVAIHSKRRPRGSLSPLAGSSEGIASACVEDLCQADSPFAEPAPRHLEAPPTRARRQSPVPSDAHTQQRPTPSLLTASLHPAKSPVSPLPHTLQKPPRSPSGASCPRFPASSAATAAEQTAREAFEPNGAFEIPAPGRHDRRIADQGEHRKPRRHYTDCRPPPLAGALADNRWPHRTDSARVQALLADADAARGADTTSSRAAGGRPDASPEDCSGAGGANRQPRRGGTSAGSAEVAAASALPPSSRPSRAVGSPRPPLYRAWSSSASTAPPSSPVPAAANSSSGARYSESPVRRNAAAPPARRGSTACEPPAAERVHPESPGSSVLARRSSNCENPVPQASPLRRQVGGYSEAPASTANPARRRSTETEQPHRNRTEDENGLDRNPRLPSRGHRQDGPLGADDRLTRQADDRLTRQDGRMDIQYTAPPNRRRAVSPTPDQDAHPQRSTGPQKTPPHALTDLPVNNSTGPDSGGLKNPNRLAKTANHPPTGRQSQKLSVESFFELPRPSPGSAKRRPGTAQFDDGASEAESAEIGAPGDDQLRGLRRDLDVLEQSGSGRHRLGSEPSVGGHRLDSTERSGVGRRRHDSDSMEQSGSGRHRLGSETRTGRQRRDSGAAEQPGLARRRLDASEQSGVRRSRPDLGSRERSSSSTRAAPFLGANPSATDNEMPHHQLQPSNAQARENPGLPAHRGSPVGPAGERGGLHDERRQLNDCKRAAVKRSSAGEQLPYSDPPSRGRSKESRDAAYAPTKHRDPTPTVVHRAARPSADTEAVGRPSADAVGKSDLHAPSPRDWSATIRHDSSADESDGCLSSHSATDVAGASSDSSSADRRHETKHNTREAVRLSEINRRQIDEDYQRQQLGLEGLRRAPAPKPVANPPLHSVSFRGTLEYIG
ncbi:Kinesin-like protein unc-104 [Diplonema papillatum]|nr:Kinesin-like protein unc-104 [Diplonema papillatum]